jgi:hypothetical protein
MIDPVLDQDRVAFLKARQASSSRKELLAAWPRSEKELPVVEIEVDWVRFSTLNHRTKAEQLQEIAKSKQADLFSADPLGPEAQEAQYRILASQEGFTKLKDDLKERRQQEPAVITAEGVLINGNRRAAALRSLFKDDDHRQSRYIRCLVLPDDATADERVDLEAELQIARDFKEEYSWINEAMLIEELYDREGKDFNRVARKMHRETSEVAGLYNKLQQLHQLVALSKGAFLHIDFKENETAFEELAKHIRSKSAEEAESVRSTYYLGTLAGVQYRELRHLRRDDAAVLVRREIEGDPTLRPFLETVADIAGRQEDGADPLDELLGQKKGSSGLNEILGYLATKRPEQSITLIDGQRVLVKDLYDTIGSAVASAAAEAEEEQRDQGAMTAPLSRADRAVLELTRALAALPRARRFDEWRESEFSAKLASLKAIIAKMEAIP